MSSAYCVGVRIETAMSLVTWSPAMGMTAVWRIAPLANTARSVVPPPMSTRHTPSSFSSSVSTAKLEASCSSTTSSTSSPQRWMHFSMFCAALSAPVTMCTLASRRTPDMPIGSRIPSWPSTMNSCGRTWSIFWSAGMATALAASITCSTSPWLTSLSRTPTTPCEFRLRTWLPAMPANTEWISQPAMSSASSTARWIDCTVDSMLTTTPFLRPREGWEPRPMTSMEPSAASSPTRATTLEVPTSRPTIKRRSERLATGSACFGFGGAGQPRGAVAPADRKAIGVAHVHVGDIHRPLDDQPQRHGREALEALIDLPAAEAHANAVIQQQLPGAARIEVHRHQAHAGLGDPAVGREIARHHLGLRAGRARQLRQLRRHEARLADERLAAGVDQIGLVPARHCQLLGDVHAQAARPDALHAGLVDPRERMQAATHLIEVDSDQACAMEPRADRLFNVDRGDVLQAAVDLDVLDRLIDDDQHRPAGECRASHARRGQRERPPRQRLPAQQRRGLRPSPVIAPADQHGVRTRLVSSTRQASSAKSKPTTRAAIGTRLWSVMPGTVLISSSSGRPAASNRKSARPQPSAPQASKAASARLASCCSPAGARPDGQK